MDLIVILCLIFWRAPYLYCFPQWLLPFSILTNSAQVFWFLQIFAYLFFNSSHPYGCEGVSHCGFDHLFLNSKDQGVKSEHLFVNVLLLSIFISWVGLKMFCQERTPAQILYISPTRIVCKGRGWFGFHHCVQPLAFIVPQD